MKSLTSAVRGGVLGLALAGVAAVGGPPSAWAQTQASLSVTKIDSPDPVVAGVNLTYTITVSNAGPSAATNTQLTDLVPANTTFVSFTAPAGWTATTPPVGGTGTVTATNASLSPLLGAQVFTLVVNVNASTPNGSTLSNTASVSSTTPDPNPANNSDTETTSVITRADLSVTKDDTPDPVVAGTNLTYTITVTNAGPSDASNVTLADPVPTNTTFVSATQTSGPAFTLMTPPVGATGTFSATAGTLAAGATATFRLVVNVNAGTPQNSVITNTATVSSATVDPNTANNSDTETTSVNAQANLQVTKTDSPDPVVAGTNLNYTITVTNAGPSNATSVQLTDVVPAGTTFVSFTTPGGWNPTTPPVGGTGTMTATRPSLAAGANQVFTLVVRVNSNVPQGGTIANTVTISSATSDPTPADNTDTETTSVNAQADLSVTKSDSPDPVAAASTLTYTITVTNAGPSDAQNVQLTDPVPANTTFFSFTAPAGWTTTTPPVGGTGTVFGTRPTLAAGSGAQVFTLVVRVNNGTPIGTTITNTATASTTTTDPNLANNSDTETTLRAPAIVTGAGPGGGPHVRRFSQTGTPSATSFFPYHPAFAGGVFVAVGDLDGVGTAEIVTGAGPGGGPHVRAFRADGSDFGISFFPYHPAFTGGVRVATGDVDGDGVDEIITAPGPGGGPHIAVWKVVGAGGVTLLAQFFAYDPGFTGGVYVAAGDVNGDGRADIITGAGAGGGPHVKVFSGMNLTGPPIASFFAYAPAFTGGVRVAAGDVNGDGRADIITAAGPGGGPHVRVFSGLNLAELRSFFAYDPSFTGGVFVAATDLTGDGRADIVTGAGAGGGPHVKVFNGLNLAVIGSFFAYDPAFRGGVGVAAGD